MGGLAGVLAFWLLAKQAEGLTEIDKRRIKGVTYRWQLLRLGLYGLVFWKAYRFDPETYHGLIGAAAGICVMQFAVPIFLGVTGCDLPKDDQADDQLPAD